ncbi:MAG: BPSS1780 family membrane protein, partial [Aeromonas veronii]
MNGLPPLRTTPARFTTGRGWLWVRSGFDIFNKGMGISVAMVLVWF